MRVVAGEAKGRRLVAPDGEATRPTSDRVREATFNALGSLGYPEDASVMDLFAGSGALGIEALSRGAAHCTFVEEDRRAVEAITANLRSTGLADRATVVRAEVLGWLGGHRKESADLALCDPPYPFDGWVELLARIAAPFVVIESNREVPAPPDWALVRSRTYGVTVVEFLEYRPAHAPELPLDENQ